MPCLRNLIFEAASGRSQFHPGLVCNRFFPNPPGDVFAAKCWLLWRGSAKGSPV